MKTRERRLGRAPTAGAQCAIAPSRGAGGRGRFGGDSGLAVRRLLRRRSARLGRHDSPAPAPAPPPPPLHVARLCVAFPCAGRHQAAFSPDSAHVALAAGTTRLTVHLNCAWCH